MIEELVHVSANLRRDGGGAAHFGRLCGWAIRRFCGGHGLTFRGLHFSRSDDSVELDGYRSFDGSRWRAALAIAALQRRRGRTALFFDHPGPARIQARLPGRRRAPYSVAVLGIDVWRALDRELATALRTARAVMAISAETSRRAEEFLPAGCRVRVVHPGLEAHRPEGNLDEPLLARLGEGYVLHVGRMDDEERYKGQDDLLEATALAAATCPGIRVVFAGDGSDRLRLEALARARGLEARVTFTGAVSGATLDEIYGRAALFAMPSRNEGFGLVFLEAMAAGRPCVALAGTAPAEIVVHGETGLLVEPTPGSIAAALAALLSDPERSRAMGDAGRRRYEQQFTARAFERRFEPLLSELVGA